MKKILTITLISSIIYKYTDRSIKMALSKKAQATKERILKAATELFYLHGYHATGLDKVIKSAEVTKGNFYYYFKSKEILAISSLDWQFEQVTHEIQNQVFNKKKSAFDTLFVLLDFMADKQKRQHAEGHICGCYFGNFTLELSTTSLAVRNKLEGIFNQYLATIESLLRQAQAEKSISATIDPVEMSAIIFGQLEGAILLDKAQQSPKHVEASIKFIKHYLSS